MQQTLEQARVRYLERSFSEWTQEPKQNAGGTMTVDWNVGANDFTREVVAHVHKRMEGKRGANFSGVSARF